MTDYADLQSDIIQSAWSDGEPIFAAAVPGMIRRAEAHLNRELQLRVMETSFSMTGEIGLRFLPLPADFAEAISLHLTTDNGYVELRPDAAGDMPLRSENARPNAWSLDGMNVALDAPCDQAHTFSFRYRKRFALSEAQPTNWLLQSHPDLYLAASLIWGSVFTLDDPGLIKWKTIADEAMASVKWAESRNRLTTATVDPALLSGSRFNISTG